MSNAMSWPNMVKSVPLQQHCRTFRVKKSCAQQESVKNHEHRVSFVLLLRLLVMRVMLASLRFPMNSLRQWLMTSLTCQCPNDPKWIQMDPNGSKWPLTLQVRLGVSSVLVCPVLTPSALVHASAVVHSLNIACLEGNEK